MAWKDPEKKKEYDRQRGQRRRAYFREYRRNNPQIQTYESHGTSIGYQGEELALKVLVGSKRIHRPCDLDWNGKLVDVKTAMPTKGVGVKRRWKFLLSKQKGVVDLFLLISKDEDGRVLGIYLVPDAEIKGKNISFSSNTIHRFKKYLLSL